MVSRTQVRFQNISVADQQAKKRLPGVLYDFIAGGTDDEVTLRANREAYARVSFRPNAGISILEPDLRTTVLGTELSLPVITAPCGGVRLVFPDGDRVLAEAVGRFGTAAIMSTALGTEVEDVAAATPGPLWFQLYFRGGKDGAAALIDRVQQAGYGALFVTIDSVPGRNHERIQKYHVPFPLRPSFRTAVRLGPRLLLRPRWLLGYLRDGMPTSFENNLPDKNRPSSLAASGQVRAPRVPESGPTWDDLQWIRELWKGPLVVKGILVPDDARKAVDVGADAIVVSNHGGRQLDGTPATLCALPEIRQAVGNQIEILIDGGIRRGTDVVKAIALGANAAMIGRPYLYGLGAAGGPGVTKVLQIFRADMIRTLRSLGIASVGSIGPAAIDARRLLTY